MAVDTRIIAGYRTHQTAMITRSNDLASGESLVNFGKLADAVSKLRCAC